MSGIEKTMLLVSSLWGQEKSFRLMPLTKDAPYSEGIYDPQSRVLVMMSSFTKETLHMIPARDENGDVAKTKTPRPGPDGKPNGKTYKEKQITLKTFTEFYVTEKEEISGLINMIAVNSDTFDYKKYLEPSPIIVPETPKLEIIKP